MLQYDHVGHADLLDGIWASAAKRSKLWVAASKVTVPYEAWSYDRVKSVDLKKYRKRLSDDALNFLLENSALDATT